MAKSGLTSTPSMSVNKLKNYLAKRIITEIRETQEIEKIPAFMIWGPPGIGKSEALEQIAKQMGVELNKTVIFHDRRLLLYNPVDLRGLPTFDDKKEKTIWVKPTDFSFDDSEDIINVLLLDELPAAPQSVQTAAYQLVLNRCIGENKLPNNVVVLAAGNRVTDKSGANKMPKALANRFTHIEAFADVDDWKNWALNDKDENGKRLHAPIDQRILGFLTFKPSALFEFNANDDSMAYPTPRSWVMANSHLKYMDIDDGYTFIAGSLGVGTATEFKAFCKLYKNLPNVKDILEGKEVEVPQSPDVLYALSSKIVSEAVKLVEVAPNGLVKKIKEKELTNLSAYINKMPVEYATVTISDMLRVKGMGTALLKIPEFKDWCKKCKKYIV